MYNQNTPIFRVVNDFEEVRTSQIDRFNKYIFADFRNGYMYIRFFNPQGIEELYTFKQIENPPSKIQILENEISELKRMIGELINDKQHVKSKGGANAQTSSIK